MKSNFNTKNTVYCSKSGSGRNSGSVTNISSTQIPRQTGKYIMPINIIQTKLSKGMEAIYYCLFLVCCSGVCVCQYKSVLKNVIF